VCDPEYDNGENDNREAARGAAFCGFLVSPFTLLFTPEILELPALKFGLFLRRQH
jgi:hypothetical protein